MWDQLDLFSGPDRPYSVSEVTGRVRALLEHEPELQDLWVQGEVSNLSTPSSGHIYFTLKDAGAQIACVIWRTQAIGLTYRPRSGDQVLVHGAIGVYEAGGRYQLYVTFVQPAGRGSLFQEFERLKARLAAEGLFDPARKRPLPQLPKRIGVVTSPTGAAFQDVLNVLRRRYPQAEVLLSPTSVQGDDAPPQIVAALAALNQQDDVDVILLVRGGGSPEDLWAFNDERVARAVAASRVPVVSGVGHETDFSLADFAADRRAPTPSAAAELSTPDRADLAAGLRQEILHMDQSMRAYLKTRQQQVAQVAQALHYLSPSARFGSARQRVDDLLTRSDAAWEHRLAREKQHVVGLTARLAALNPEAVLRRGYAIVRDQKSGRILPLAKRIRPGQALLLQMQDGEVPARSEAPQPFEKTEGVA